MTNATRGQTAFGDYLAPIDRRVLASRIQSLSQIFADVLETHADLSGYFEAMLVEMSSEAKAVLFLKLARWLKNQPQDFVSKLDRSYAGGTLLEAFEATLAEWAQEMASSATATGTRIRNASAEPTETISRRNPFGDVLQPIDESSLAARIRSLNDAFSKVLQQHADVSGYFGTMLGEMSSEAKTLLFLKLSRWLNQQTKAFEGELQVLHIDGQLLDVFEAALANWAQEVMLKASARNGRIREVYPTQLFPTLGEICVPVGVIHQESHHENHADMAYVCAMAGAVGAMRIFEFGTYRGQTTCGLASVCKDARIYTLNLPPEADPRYAAYIGMFIARSRDRERIEQLLCDSRTFDTEPYRNSIDYIFIDGDHSYEGVKNDTEKALQMLRPGGLIVWHDYAAKSPGVLEYLAEFSQRRPLFRLRKTCIAVYVDGLNPESAELAPMDASLEEQEYGSELAR